ncbi:HK97-gp10 family putative phage morphogenesis protein [Tianweitania sediminis]|uniref:HK97 gp10 family phage protein n=1 Tax=Tianweitania sediminis TaxID=1502156 RepID=A0A8J7UI18_9HYPH|nr:HK97-gp10 family putative phage morphogenesis protein [Tianweitania sediminis]MBP0438423.1 HK97 gp10 family phage protein [Tianweitania sediminis]
MAIKAKMLGREKTMKLLRGIVPEAEKELAKAQMEAAQDLASKIRPRAPGPRTGQYQASIQADRLANRTGQQPVSQGLRGSTKDPNATGVFADFIWRFLEFGTVKMAKRPHIFPTYRQERPRIRRKMAASVRKAVKKVKTK